MTNTPSIHSAEITTASKTESSPPAVRRLQVGYLPNQGKGFPKPQLKLAGQWLADCGFTCGQNVELQAEPGKLIITLKAPDALSPSPAVPAAIDWQSAPVGVLRFGRLRPQSDGIHEPD